jgi:hypothetical protein
MMNITHCPQNESMKKKMMAPLNHHWQKKSIKKMVRLVVYQEDGPMGPPFSGL